jgi:3-methyladenine DNA glycosylase AlkD
VDTEEAQRLVDGIESRLRAHADPARATTERAYLKSSLEHIGVNVATTRKITREVAPDTRHDVIALAKALWQQPVHERRLATVELLAYRRSRLTAADLPYTKRLIHESMTWAYVDHLAELVVGDIVERIPDSAAELGSWATDDDFWVRRSALLALLGPLRRGDGDLERFSRYADSMLDEKEFFIRKAIGWVLRDAGKKQPDWVADWLAQRPGRVPVLAVREAVKNLPAADRQAFIDAAAGRRPR